MFIFHHRHQMDALLSKMLKTAPWTSFPWEWFVDMNKRLISPPESNFAHWDFIDKPEIELYLNRCLQLSDEECMPPQFRENWKNLNVALEHCQKLRSQWQPLPVTPTYEVRRFPPGIDPFYDDRQNDVRPIKQAMREGKVFDPNGSMIGNKEFLEAARRANEDLLRCVELQDESRPPVQITVDHYLEERAKPTLFAVVLKDFNKSDRLELT